MSNISILNDQYKLESLSLLPDYCLQEIFSNDIKNIAVAKIVFLLSSPSRQTILSNLNNVRSAKISETVKLYDSGELSSSFSSFEKTCELLLDRVQQLKDTGIIQIPQIVLDDSILNYSNELNTLSDNIPRFNFYYNDLHDLISWWNLAANSIRSIFGKRIQVENIILERLEDEFSSKIFAHSIDDIGKKDFHDRADELREHFFKSYKTRLNIIESFFLALLKNDNNKTFIADLSSNFQNDEEIADQLKKYGPLLILPAIKDNLPPEDIAMSLYKLKLIFDESGIDEMNKFINKVEDHFFKKCLSIIQCQMNKIYAQKIIIERKKAQLNEIEIKLKMIIDAVTCIRNNITPYIMLELMSSYTVYDFEE
ncbi:hypothetical protein [Maridesulfovibrio zosterae]|uniref:hypothetical protein n=1 Tax=Maridesulfovibrio zosterae TaxID=82171 RepID=UPI0003F60BFC|nr:hypothetical protein [Maridesulfovibrio zosterae]